MTKTVKLYEVATIATGNSAPQDEKLFIDGIHNFVRTSDVGQIRKGIIFEARDKLNDKGILKLKKFPKGTILFPKSGASTFLNHRVMLGMDAYVSSHLATIKGDNSKVLDSYLLYILQTIDAENLVADSSYPSLKTQTISEIELVLPSILEQHHIVSKLDTAFAEIDKAMLINKSKSSSLRNIEKKIINKLILNNGSNFVKKPIHSLFNLSSGKFLPRKKMNLKGKIKVYGGNGISGYHDACNLENENILIGRVGAYCGNVYYTNERIWLTDNCLHINSYQYDFDKKFLSMLLSSLNLRVYAHQAAQPAISYSSLKDIELIFPKSIDEQTMIFRKYIELKSNLKNLNNNYESQMVSFKKLRLSILNKQISNKAA